MPAVLIYEPDTAIIGRALADGWRLWFEELKTIAGHPDLNPEEWMRHWQDLLSPQEAWEEGPQA